ncbi:hypothetical protein JAAARDRAFT_196685 [Jaapia argillacea MUCL 33604]|uniref:Arginyl-tRNA synthetase catalytic core domain-containing protein n=1 Tax=Jaapia argillacea MUCL 33604 TaxID=933084 RepID=A0A067PVH5_9AGAM|nr:hypothetical protein JAAARDRAFT_196685 [Jaapia argillacea MUCL 33604]
MEWAVGRLEELGLVSDVDGAKLVDLEKWKLGKAVLRKKGSSFLSFFRLAIPPSSDRRNRDLPNPRHRRRKQTLHHLQIRQNDLRSSSQQDLHLSQFFKILSLLSLPSASTLEHVSYGMVLGMSTRKGTVVFLDQIIKEAGNVMLEQMMKNEEKYKAVEDPEGVCREIGITGIKIQDMAAKRINNFNFNWDGMKSFEGDTGPYLQYAHVGLSSISRKNPSLLPLPSSSLISPSLLTEPQAREIIFLLGTYPDVVKTAPKTRTKRSGDVCV